MDADFEGDEAQSEWRAFTAEREGDVMRVTLVGPGKGNALGPDFWAEARVLFTALSQDVGVRAIVLDGANDTFTYGLDLPATREQLMHTTALAKDSFAYGRRRLLDMLTEMQQGMIAVMRCPKPIVACISGWCIGAGIDLICAADIRVASRDAMFSVRAARIGIVEDMGSLQRLPIIIGEGRARELALTGEDFDAPRALEIGLLNHVVPTPQDARVKAMAIAQRIAGNPPLTVQGVKQVMNEYSLASMDAALRHTALWNAAFLPSRDFDEAMRAFMEKRAPRFTGT